LQVYNISCHFPENRKDVGVFSPRQKLARVADLRGQGGDEALTRRRCAEMAPTDTEDRTPPVRFGNRSKRVRLAASVAL
jgi:hypothetical protein